MTRLLLLLLAFTATAVRGEINPFTESAEQAASATDEKFRMVADSRRWTLVLLISNLNGDAMPTIGPIATTYPTEAECAAEGEKWAKSKWGNGGYWCVAGPERK